MADIDSSAISGIGSLFKTVDVESSTISSGASGDILDVAAGEGQYLKINYLLSSGTSGSESAITLTVDGNDIITNSALDDSTPSGDFGVSNYFTSPSTSGEVSGSRGLVPYIYCTAFTLTKVSGVTARAINYSYEILEPL